jgi:hypothetical protein
MEALALDVRNYDAFKELIDGGMMTPEEGELTLEHDRGYKANMIVPDQSVRQNGNL